MFDLFIKWGCGCMIFAFILLSGQTVLADHYLVGRWLDKSQSPEVVVEIYMENNDFFMFKKMPQGQTSSKKVERKVDDHGVMTFRTLDANYINNAFVVTPKTRKLTILDREGRVLTAPELITFEPEPAEDSHAEAGDDHHDEKDSHGEKDDHHD